MVIEYLHGIQNQSNGIGRRGLGGLIELLEVLFYTLLVVKSGHNNEVHWIDSSLS